MHQNQVFYCQDRSLLHSFHQTAQLRPLTKKISNKGTFTIERKSFLLWQTIFVEEIR